MICKKCGKEILPTERFCGNCGTPNDNTQAQQTSARSNSANSYVNNTANTAEPAPQKQSAVTAPVSKLSSASKNTPIFLTAEERRAKIKTPSGKLLLISGIAFLFIFVMWFTNIFGHYKFITENYFSLSTYAGGLYKNGEILFTVPVCLLTITAAFDCLRGLCFDNFVPKLIVAKVASIVYTGSALILALEAAEKLMLDISIAGILILLIGGGLIALSFIIPGIIKKEQKKQ